MALRHKRALFLALAALPALAASEVPKKVDYCALKQNPAAYNHAQVEVAGFFMHGFEDFTMFDPTCTSWFDIWVEYGGTAASGTMYCCGTDGKRSRSKPPVVEGIEVTLLQDRNFTEFDRLLHLRASSVVRATVLGRFFAGEESSLPGGTRWRGYGHMACCSLLVIQQVLSVDKQDRTDLDYSWDSDRPEWRNAIGVGDMIPVGPFGELLEGQRAAESGQRPWAFDDPSRVATEALARLTKTPEESVAGMRLTKKAPGRLVYEWQPKAGRFWYMVVLSRAYWVSYFARDPNRVAWGVLAAIDVERK